MLWRRSERDGWDGSHSRACNHKSKGRGVPLDGYLVSSTVVSLPSRRTRLFPPIQHPIHNPPLQRLLGTHEEIPLHDPGNLLQRLAPALRGRQMPLIDPIQLLPHPQNLLRVDRDVARLPVVPARDLMHHDPTVRQHVPFPRRAAAEEQAAHGGRLAEADGADGAADVLHRVVDGEAGGDGPAGTVDVEVDGFLGVFGFEEEELGDDAGRGGFFHFAVQADDAFFQ